VVAETPNSTTVVGVQGFHVRDVTDDAKPAGVFAVSPDGDVTWTADDVDLQVGAWVYDVEPRADGTVLVTSPRANGTAVILFDPATGERRWTETLPTRDTHDVDLLPNGNLLVADMRNYDVETGVSNDRAFVYNRTTDAITWEWYFRDNYPDSMDGGHSPDWSHVNDVDAVGDGRILLSVRDFDQAIVVDRESGDIVRRLGREDAHDVLYEQHNPDFFVDGDGTPTMLVADSENDRIVEYAYDGSGWTRTWTLTANLAWPRDADRLPNGHTLVTDTLNHRIVEVTPTGEVVWEYYAPWAPYDADRTATGDGSHGPSMAELNVTGTYAVSGGSAPAHPVRDALASVGDGTGAGPTFDSLAARYGHVEPFVRPVWASPTGFVAGALAILLVVAWLLVELGRFALRRVRG
jgi:hypothetical protein